MIQFASDRRVTLFVAVRSFDFAEPMIHHVWSERDPQTGQSCLRVTVYSDERETTYDLIADTMVQELIYKCVSYTDCWELYKSETYKDRCFV